MILEIDHETGCACIDGACSVKEIDPYARMFPKGQVYRGGILLWFKDYPLETIRDQLDRKFREVVLEEGKTP